MSRILLTLSVLSVSALLVAFASGIQIDNPAANDPAVQAIVSRHFLISLGALAFATFVHALVLTYFMGTGRWIEETTAAYHLDARFLSENRSLKYRVLPVMVGCVLLLVATGATGSAADPASPVAFRGWGPLSPSELHFWLSSVTMLANAAVHIQEVRVLGGNGRLIAGILDEVRRIRREKGLPE